MYRSEFLARDSFSVSEVPENFNVRTARSREDLESAFALIQARYRANGLANDDDLDLRIMPHQLSNASQVFIAEKAGQVAGTITLVRDFGKGLPMDVGYPEAASRLRKTGLQIGEITSLAVDPMQLSHGEIFVKLTRLLTFFARAQGLQHLAAVVHPRHAKFYQHAMRFQVIGQETSYAAVGGNRGIAILGSVNDPSGYRRRWHKCYFEGGFADNDLKPCQISDWDRMYFMSKLQNSDFKRAG